jgi:murein hydrolase activator
VLLQHGDFYTVYSNLDEVYVQLNDPVESHKTIGKLGADKPEVHFEIWQEKVKLNPTDWVAKR